MVSELNNHPLVNRATLIRVRRLMVTGLVASVFGNSLVGAGFDATAAAGVITVSFLVAIKSLEEVAVFLFPLYARIVAHFSPDSALIAVDLAEAVLSFLGVLAIATGFVPAPVVLALFILIDSFLAPVSDIADEFYGVTLARSDEEVALGFNAFIYSAVATLGFVVGGPLGSYFASLSISTLLIANIVLSCGGAAFRVYARHQWPAPPVDDVDDDDWQATGESMPVKQFLHDLFLSGPASPLVSFLISLASTQTGELFFIWTARRVDTTMDSVSAYSAMGVVLAVFGVAAAIGPLLATQFKKRTNLTVVLRATTFGVALILLIFLLYLHGGRVHGLAVLAFLFTVVILNRIRLVVLETYRQVTFTGKRFARIMSWSFTFSAGGTLAGLQVGFLTGLASDPAIALSIAVVLWIIVGIVISIPPRTLTICQDADATAEPSAPSDRA